MDAYMRWAERGRAPDWAIRAGIRRLLARRLAAERVGGLERQGEALQGFIDELRCGPVAVATGDANAQHYELPAGFFRLMLGPRLKYSACLWDGADGLARAEEAMLDLTCRRAAIEDGQDILELGCGWGSLTRWMAERYPRCRIVAVSNSASQRRYIEARCAAEGLGNVSVVTADMNTFDAGRAFDRVVSVEMFEHMRNWEELLRRVRGWLRDDGALFLHVFCHREHAYGFADAATDDWMGRYFFTGGIMPCSGLPFHFQRDLLVRQHWWVDGRHYARTLRAWLARLDADRAGALDILREHYGPGEARRWLGRWRIFLLACAELFGYRGGSEWFVGHYRLVPRGRGADSRGGAA